MYRYAALILFYFATTSACKAIAQSPPVFIFEHANVIDGVSTQPLRDTTVVVRDGKIGTVGRAASLPGAQRIDLAGHWMLPGLIDVHVHPMDLEGAQEMLKAGVTTARSMLTVHYIDVGLRELHHRGAADIPEILAAGYPVVPNLTQFKPDITGIFLDTTSLDDLRQDSDIGVDGVRRLVRANLEHHVDVIKVFATDRAGVASSDPRRRLLSNEELAAAIAEAHKAGVRVGSHAHGDEGAAAAVRAGADTIEHGTYLSNDTLRLMLQRHVCFTPTLAVAAVEVNPSSNSPEQVALAIRSRSMLPRARETTRHAHNMGVTVIAGSDSSYTPDDPQRIADEMAELAGVGMTNMEVIQAATSKAAECLGIAQRTGAIRSGMEADLIVLDRNPLEDINAVRDVLLVVNDGKLAFKHLTF
jgi:imidazolonepropionase-like amidohydrolase